MTRSRHLCLAVFVLCLAVAFSGCSKGERTSGDVFGQEFLKVDLKAPDKAQALGLARAVLTGKDAPAADKSSALQEEGLTGVFATLARPGQRAVTAFATGRTPADAVEKAAKGLHNLAEDKTEGALRLDFATDAKKPVKQKIGDKLKVDVSDEGIIFNTKPMTAFLGQELRGYGVVKKDYIPKEMKNLIKARGYDKAVESQIAKGKEVKWVIFKLTSFMEGENGGVIDLARGNRLDGFEPTPERLLAAINAAGDYLKKATGPDGRFEYLYHPDKNSVDDAYNLLRHAGTAFSMGQIYEINKDPELLEAIKRALDYLEKNSKGPDENDSKTYDWKAVVEKTHAKLGGAGLALLAYTKYTEISGDKHYLPLMQAYGRFVDYLKEPNGDLRQRYWYKAEDKAKVPKPVLYYPGEAFFGLMRLHAIDNDPKWTDIAEKGIDYIADVRDANTPTEKLEHDHWMMYAVNEMDKLKAKENHTKHAYRVMEAMFAKFGFESPYPEFVGGWFKRPKVTPTACRLEATCAFYRLVDRKGDKEMSEKVFRVVDLGAGFLMRNQYNKINSMFLANPDKVLGGYPFDWWDPSIQIDVVQHSTSALVATREIIMKRQAAAPSKPAS